MRLIRFALLYLALALGANAALAVDLSEVRPLASGDMRKLVFHDQPKPVSTATFLLEDGREATLADFRGRYVLVNFWATWCAPCRAEMPTLAALQAEFGGDRFQVLTLATGRNSKTAIDRFFDTAGVTNLPRHTDPRMAVARDMNVLGLPVSVLIDPEGHEIARLTGEADWHSDSARAILAALLGQD